MRITTTPINRNSLFYSELDFDYETELAQIYIEEDLGQTVILYQVDYRKSNVDSIYKETGSDGVSYKTPIELPCMYNLEDNVLKSYDSTTQQGNYTVYGKLTIYMPIKSLEKYQCDVNRGDYIALQTHSDNLEYFSVINDGKLNGSNTHVLGAYKPGFRTIVCSPASEEEFFGKRSS